MNTRPRGSNIACVYCPSLRTSAVPSTDAPKRAGTYGESWRSGIVIFVKVCEEGQFHGAKSAPLRREAHVLTGVVVKNGWRATCPRSWQADERHTHARSTIEHEMRRREGRERASLSSACSALKQRSSWRLTERRCTCSCPFSGTAERLKIGRKEPPCAKNASRSGEQ